MLQRKIGKITQSPWQQGFLGAGHSASAVLGGIAYEQSDPFIVFMDDRLHLPGGAPVGGAHPHAGFETLTLVLKGNDKDWETGSFELITAGKGIVHTEEITAAQDIHILQVWLALPPDKRWIAPSWQKILPEAVPAIKNEQHEIRVYSGSSNGLVSPLQNHTPFTLVDFRMKSGQNLEQELPAGYHGLIYVLEGAVQVGDKAIKAKQAGWLAPSDVDAMTALQFTATGEDTHFVLYAAKPHHAAIISHGPFIGDSPEDINRLYRAYRNGEMPHLNDLPQEQKVIYKTSQPDEV